MTAAIPPSGASRGRRLSDVLGEIANDPDRATITIADIRDAMGDRAFGALLFVLAAPNAFPISVPGVSAILGLPIMFLAMQLIVGRSMPWLPRAATQRAMRRQSFARAMNAIAPWIRCAERLLQPRLHWLASGPLERVVGLAVLLLAAVLALPVPFGNLLPALAICVLGLALLEKDGLAVLVGLVAAAAAVVFGWAVILAIVKAVSLFLRHLIGT